MAAGEPGAPYEASAGSSGIEPEVCLRAGVRRCDSQADEVLTEGIKPNFEQGTVEACRGTLGARSSSTTFRLSRLTPFTSGCVLLISARLSECRGFPVQVLSQHNGSFVLPLIVLHLSR